MLNQKKISKSGSVTIPSHIRRGLGISKGETLEIKSDESGKLILERVEGSCLLCGTHENLMKVDKVYICENCGTKVHEALKERGE